MSEKQKRCRNSPTIAFITIMDKHFVMDGSNMRHMRDNELYLLASTKIRRVKASSYCKASTQCLISPNAAIEGSYPSSLSLCPAPASVDQMHLEVSESNFIIDDNPWECSFPEYEWNF